MLELDATSSQLLECCCINKIPFPASVTADQLHSWKKNKCWIHRWLLFCLHCTVQKHIKCSCYGRNFQSQQFFDCRVFVHPPERILCLTLYGKNELLLYLWNRYSTSCTSFPSASKLISSHSISKQVGKKQSSPMPTWMLNSVQVT